jgi:FdhD protein
MAAGLTWSVRRVWADRHEDVNDQVVLEEPLSIVLNGIQIAILMRMPGSEKELAAGFCVSEGYVRAAQDILLIHHCGSGHPVPGQETETGMDSRNRVQVHARAESIIQRDQPDVVRLIRSGCGAADVSALSEDISEVTSELRVQATVLLELPRKMRARQEIHNTIGGAHGAALYTVTGRQVVLAEDIGRHNAVDKAVGNSLLRGLGLEDKVLITSGRASYEMVAKAIRLQIPIVASISAPTSLAVQIAQEKGLTLIGYLRGGRMNIYAHAQRVLSTS